MFLLRAVPEMILLKGWVFVFCPPPLTSDKHHPQPPPLQDIVSLNVPIIKKKRVVDTILGQLQCFAKSAVAKWHEEIVTALVSLQKL